MRDVAEPNVNEAMAKPGDLRSAVNAILSLDALVGQVHAALLVSGKTVTRSDEAFRDEIGSKLLAYRIVKDVAAALKHGRLDRPKAQERLVRDATALRPGPARAGTMRAGDALVDTNIELESGFVFVARHTLWAAFLELNRWLNQARSDFQRP